jgi:isopropylmalate/homocitrate/citramalate synthase
MYASHKQILSILLLLLAFSMTRYVSIGHRLTGWNAVKNRVQQLGLQISDEDVKKVTAQIKELADIRPLAIDEVDTLLRKFHDKITMNGTAAADGLIGDGEEEEAEKAVPVVAS